MAAKIDHAKIKRLVLKYRKDTTVFKHYRKTNKNGKKQDVLAAIAKSRSELPLRLRSPKRYKTKLNHQKNHTDKATKYKIDFIGGLPAEYGDGYMKHAPPWAKVAKESLNRNEPLKDVKKSLEGYVQRDKKLVSEIEALKLKLIKAETEQTKVRGRIECMRIFLADEKTITIAEWMLE